MPDIATVAGMVAGVLAIVGFVPYILATLRKGIKPNRATWWIWTIVGFILGATYLSSGDKHAIWVPVSLVIGPLTIAILSMKYGEGGWTRFDRSCALGAAASAVLWGVFGSPLVALVINLFIDVLGALPTIRKSYQKPETENRTAWALFFAGDTINLFAIKSWSFATAAYPLYLFLLTGTMMALLFGWRRSPHV